MAHTFVWTTFFQLCVYKQATYKVYFKTVLINVYSCINFITPCEAIKIYVVCGNVEDLDDFQIQHNSFHNHPSKSNQVQIVYCYSNNNAHSLKEGCKLKNVKILK